MYFVRGCAPWFVRCGLGARPYLFYSMHQRGTHQVCVLPFRAWFIYLLCMCYLLYLGGVVEVDCFFFKKYRMSFFKDLRFLLAKFCVFLCLIQYLLY